MPRFGIGYRTQHFAELAERPPGVDWLELLSDNHLGTGGPRRAQLEKLRATFPVALHGVSLGVANDSAPSAEYVAALRELADFVQPLYVSDHLCWTGLGGVRSHDLLPVATTRELLALVGERVARVQDGLGRRLLLENASAYVKFRDDEMSEAELLAALCERTGCGVLLDVNNLYVNALNLGSDPHAALASLQKRHVGYLHVAGHATWEDVRIDTHGAAVPREVWQLFEHAARRFPDAGVMLERDDAIPPLAELRAELDQARAHWRQAQTAAPAEPPMQIVRTTRRPSSGRRSPATWQRMQRAFWVSVADAQPATEVAVHLDACVPVPPRRGLRVYRDAYRRMPERVLGTNFPALARVLARDDFSALCRAYARVHPATSHDPVRFGGALADFVARFSFANRYAVDRSALADIARLEQAQLEAQEAPEDASALAPSRLAGLCPAQWEQARFVFSRALRIVFARWDVLPTVEAAAGAAPLGLPRRGTVAYLVARREGVVHTHAVAPAGARALEALAAGASFAAACRRAGGDVAASARALVAAAGLGALTAVEPGVAEPEGSSAPHDSELLHPAP